jgi:hypothetical protein
MQVRILPAAPLPGGVKVARRFVKPHGVGASPTLAAKFGRQAEMVPVRKHLAAPVPKTGSASPVGALPTISASLRCLRQRAVKAAAS